MADDVEVKFGASTQPLEAGVAKAAGSVNTGVTAMRVDLDALVASAKAAQEAMVTSFAGIGGAISGVQGILGSLVGIIAGGQIFSSVISTTQDWIGETVKLSKALGIGTEEASVLQVALHQIGVSNDTYTSSLFKMERQMKNNEDNLIRLGVATRDQNGKVKDGDELMRAALTTMMQYKAGFDRNAASMTFFGRGAQEAMQLQKLLSVNMEEAAQRAKDLGLIVGGDLATANKQYKETVQEAKLAVEALEIAIGSRLIPSLADSKGKLEGLVTSVRVLIQAFKDVLAILDLVVTAFVLIGDVFITLGNHIYAIVMGMGDVLKEFVKDPVDGLSVGAEKMWQRIKAANEKGAAEFRKQMDDIKKDLKTLFVLPDEPKIPPRKENTGKEFPGKDDSADDRLKQWQDELTKMEMADQNYFKDRKALEARFWTEKLSMAQDDDKLMMQVRQKQFAALRALAMDDRAFELATITEKSKESDQFYALEVQKVKDKKSLNMISATDELKRLQQLEEDKFQLELRSLNQKMDLAYQDRNLQLQIDGEIMAAKQRHAMEVQRLETQQAQITASRWQQAAGMISSAFGTAISGMLNATETFAQAAGNMVNAVVSGFIGMAVKMADEWAMKQLLMTLFGEEEATKRVTNDTIAAAAGAQANSAASVTKIFGDAAVAAAATFASISAIPMVGPELAPEAAAIAWEATAAWATAVPLAVGAWEIPRDMLAVVHQGEQVVPKTYADGARASGVDSAYGRDSNAGAESTNNTSVNLSVSTLDAKSFNAYIQNPTNLRTLAKAVGSYFSNNPSMRPKY